MNMQLVEKIQEIANQKNITAAQLSLAWLLSKNVVVIPGTTKSFHGWRRMLEVLI